MRMSERAALNSSEEFSLKIQLVSWGLKRKKPFMRKFLENHSSQENGKCKWESLV